MIYVLDACAMIAYLRGEKGDDVVANMLSDPAHTCYAHFVNMCEVYYLTVRSGSVADAQQAVRNLKKDGLVIRRDASARLWQAAAQLKARGGIALPDCFCIALAQHVGGEIVTSDHGEFDPLVPLGLCPINFIR